MDQMMDLKVNSIDEEMKMNSSNNNKKGNSSREQEDKDEFLPPYQNIGLDNNGIDNLSMIHHHSYSHSLPKV